MLCYSVYVTHLDVFVLSINFNLPSSELERIHFSMVLLRRSCSCTFPGSHSMKHAVLQILPTLHVVNKMVNAIVNWNWLMHQEEGPNYWHTCTGLVSRFYCLAKLVRCRNDAISPEWGNMTKLGKCSLQILFCYKSDKIHSSCEWLERGKLQYF